MARHYLAALAFVLGATGVRVALDPYLGEAPGLSIFLLAVLGSAWIGGLGPAILALVSGALIADFWFVEPRNDLGTREPRVLVAFIGYVIMGLGIAGAVFLERRSRKRAEADYQSARLRAADLERRDSDAETRFRMLADSVPVLLWMSGPQKHRSYFNRQWLEFRGRTLDEEEADGWLEGVHPLDLGAIEECKRAFAERTAFQAQFRLKRHDGEYRWVIDSGVPRYSPDGSFLGFSGGSIDITDLKESEAERQVLLEKLTVLVEVSSTLISSLDLGDTLPRILALASRVVAADAFAMWRFLPDEDRWRIIASEGLSERYQDEAVRAVSHLRARLESPLVVEDLDREESLAAQRDIQHAEGIVSLLAMPLRILGESNGTLVFYYRSRHTFSEVELRTATAMANLAAASIDSALLHETTERARVRAERAAEQVARLQRITEALSDACTSSEVCDVAVEEGMAALGASQGAAGLVTPDGEALEVVCAIGYRDEVVRSWRRVPIHAPLPPADAARTGEIVFLETAEQRITRYPFLAQVPGLDTDASVCVPLLVQGRVLGVVAFGFERETSFSSEDRSFLLALGRHCAQALERARLYDVEQQARAAAEEANRSKDAFLAMLAHELRNPLVPLWNGLELLHRPAALSAEELERAKETMRRQMRHLARLIEDLLDVSRLTSGKILLRPEPSDLTELIRTVAEDMKGIFEPAEVDLIIRIPDVPVWVRVDRTRISQVLGNLLSNAAKFTDKGGRVLISLEEDSEGSHETPMVSLNVTDTGIGIDPSMIPHLFDAFTQGDSSLERSHGGLGLGLSLVKGLVELHGGTVGCESAGLGKGATFTIRLPLGAPPEESEIETVDFDESVSRRVVVIEDNVDAAFTMQLLLRLRGHDVRTAHSGPEGLRVVTEALPDVIFCDIGLPGGMNGYEVAKTLRADSTFAATYLVALTGYGRAEDAEEARRAGFDLHLTKPVDPDRLMEIAGSLSLRRGA